MKTRMLAGAVIAAFAIAMTGCVSTPGVVMDKSKPIEQGGYSLVGVDEVSSTGWFVSVFGVPLPPIYMDGESVTEDILSGSPGRVLYKNALYKVRDTGADALIEYTLDSQSLWLYILTVGRYTLAGTPVKTNNAAK